jgi:hypothetical protein
MSKPKSMLAPLALALSILASPTLAADGKTMPGSACQPEDEARPRTLSRESGAIANLGNAAEKVFCPVVKDLSNIERAVVMVIDRNPDAGADIVCELETVRSNGTVQSGRGVPSNGAFAVAQPLNFGFQPAAANGSYDLVCTLPPRNPAFGAFAIVNYTVVEN